tara:strand:+ start:188 stop:295 length:108 start_codon:yes stop_codon:yes gene_type:complete
MDENGFLTDDRKETLKGILIFVGFVALVGWSMRNI